MSLGSGSGFFPRNGAAVRMTVEARTGYAAFCGLRVPFDPDDVTIYGTMVTTREYDYTGTSGFIGTSVFTQSADTTFLPEGASLCSYSGSTVFTPPYSDPGWSGINLSFPTSISYSGSGSRSTSALYSEARANFGDWEVVDIFDFGGNDRVFPSGGASAGIEIKAVTNDTSGFSTAAGNATVVEVRVKLERDLEFLGASLAPIRIRFKVTRDNGYGEDLVESDTDDLGMMLLPGGEMETEYTLSADNGERVFLSDPVTLVGRWIDKTRGDILD